MRLLRLFRWFTMIVVCQRPRQFFVAFPFGCLTLTAGQFERHGIWFPSGYMAAWSSDPGRINVTDAHAHTSASRTPPCPLQYYPETHLTHHDKTINAPACATWCAMLTRMNFSLGYAKMKLWVLVLRKHAILVCFNNKRSHTCTRNEKQCVCALVLLWLLHQNRDPTSSCLHSTWAFLCFVRMYLLVAHDLIQ